MKRHLYDITVGFFYLFVLLLPFEKSQANVQCLSLFTSSEKNISSNKPAIETQNDPENNQEREELSLSEDSSEKVSRNGVILKRKMMDIHAYEKVKITSFFSADRSIEIQLFHSRETNFDPADTQKTGLLFLNMFQKILHQYALAGVTFPDALPRLKFNSLGANANLKVFTKGQKRWRLSLDLESTKPMNADVFRKKISAQSFTHQNLTKETMDIAIWMLMHEMGHTKVEQLIGRANHFVHFKALNEGIADFYSWFGSQDRNFTSDLIDSRRGANINYEDALKFIENRDIHRAGRFITRQIIAIYELSKKNGQSDAQFIRNFEAYLEHIKPIIIDYGPYFHLWHFSDGMIQFFQNSAGLASADLTSLAHNFKIAPPKFSNLYSLELNRKSNLTFPEISLDSLVLDTGNSLSKPKAAFSFPDKNWLNGQIFQHAYHKFWLSENGDLYLIHIEIDKKTNSSSYLARFELTEIHSIEEITASASSSFTQQQKPLTVELAIHATEDTLRYSLVNSQDHAVIKDFIQNHLLWLLNGVGGKPQ